MSWCAQRQSIVTLSSTEAEYVAAATAAREATWLRQLLCDFDLICHKPIILRIDNMSAIQLVRNPVFHRQTKHIEIRHHYVREQYEKKIIQVEYVPSDLQLADILTKALSFDQHEFLCKKIGMTNLDDLK